MHFYLHHCLQEVVVAAEGLHLFQTEEVVVVAEGLHLFQTEEVVVVKTPNQQYRYISAQGGNLCLSCCTK